MPWRDGTVNEPSLKCVVCLRIWIYAAVYPDPSQRLQNMAGVGQYRASGPFPHCKTAPLTPPDPLSPLVTATGAACSNTGIFAALVTRSVLTRSEGRTYNPRTDAPPLSEGVSSKHLTDISVKGLRPRSEALGFDGSWVTPKGGMRQHPGLFEK
jgi:hypothetical protein